MNDDLLQTAQSTVQHLPAHIDQLTLHCPLCNATAPVRGIMARNITKPSETNETRWELAFICPNCGLYSTFALDRLKTEQIKHLAGSHWAAQLREHSLDKPTETFHEVISFEKHIAHFGTTFTACAVLWLLLTGSFAPIDLLWGLVVCIGVSLLTFRFVAFDAPTWMLRPRSVLAFLQLIAEFVRQIIVQNVTLSRRVFSRTIPIKPGIVAVPFNARRDTSATILSSLITLTPDTVVLDIDQAKGILYIHWIDVKTTNPEEAYQLLVKDLEEKLTAWLD